MADAKPAPAKKATPRKAIPGNTKRADTSGRIHKSTDRRVKKG